MQTYNIYYESALTFHLLPMDEINRAKSILIQIFSGTSSRTMLEKLVRETRVFFPNAIITGVTTAGEISDSKLTTHKTLISITTFKKTKVTSLSIDAVTPQNSFEAGELLADKLLKRDTRLLILYTEGLYVNSDDFLAGVNKKAQGVPVCGGVAADNGKFFETFIFHDDKILTKGAVGIALSGKHLRIRTDYMSSWEAVGPNLQITRAVKNRVYEINGQNAIALFRHYLGDHFIENLPETGFEISLTFEKDGCLLNRNAVAISDDGALVFTGNIPPKSLCKFGYLDRNRIAPDSMMGAKAFEETDMESFFIFCGLGRKRYLKEVTAKQVDLFANVATVSGFFGYGEYVHKDGINCLQNQSCTVIGLSEDSGTGDSESVCMIYHDNDGSEVQRSLAHLVTVTNQELEEKAKQLETLLSYLPAGVLYFDNKLQITLYNELAFTYLGIDKNKDDFRDLNMLKMGWVTNLFRETLLHEESVSGGALAENGDGKQRYIRIKTVPLKRGDELVGAMAIIQSEGKIDY
ncbi:MAG: FIST C-terminal domain-containing protein [Hydrogenimonas sp.]|nr:FIST C-terminal domain-containing protein [Hydrogenimonas sp.]